MYRNLIGILLLITSPAFAQVKAFPGAQGYGATAVGGRGGAVMEVTNLNNSGAGSLRACVEATGPRTCVFRVGGTIRLNSSLSINSSRSKLTIAGQTAPGGGITLALGPTVPSGSRHLILISGQDVIIRHIRVRSQFPNTVTNSDLIAVVSGGNRVYLDHISGSWATDENLNTYANWNNVTVAYSIWAEGLDSHSKCALLGDDPTITQYITWWRNLCISNNDRNPNINQGPGCTDIVDNVFYNPRSEFGEIFSQFSNTPSNWVQNYFKAGPATNSSTRAIYWNTAGSRFKPKIYHFGNVTWAPSGKSVTLMDSNTASAVVGSPVCPLSVTPISGGANSAYDEVRAQVGAWPRDSKDTQYITQLAARGVAGTGPSSILTSPGALPTIANGPAATDADHDGMADTWEALNGLSSSNASDRNGDLDTDGYTNLEEYLHYRHQQIIGAPPPDTTPPSLPIVSAGAIVTQCSIQLSWPASTDNVAVTGYSIRRNGSPLVSVVVPGYTDGPVPPGTYTYEVQAVDSAGNLSGIATNTVVCQ